MQTNTTLEKAPPRRQKGPSTAVRRQTARNRTRQLHQARKAKRGLS